MNFIGCILCFFAKPEKQETTFLRPQKAADFRGAKVDAFLGPPKRRFLKFLTAKGEPDFLIDPAKPYSELDCNVFKENSR